MSRLPAPPEDTVTNREGNRLTETPRRHSEPAFLSNAQRLGIENSTLNNVAGHVFNFNELPPTYFNQQAPPHANSAIIRYPSSSSTTEMCQNDGEVYARLLLPKKFGFPLWIPQPHRNLPREYRRNGVNIGDVGIITSGGVFDFLFNVCLPSHHSINGGRVPDNFKPLDPPEPVDIINVTVASTYIASRSIERSEVHPTRANAGFSFRCLASEGAVLTLPDGASREDCQEIARFREYAAQHAENWYKYVNGSRGRDAGNGSIYLVTGYDKSKSWGVASFSDASCSFDLTFIPSPDEGENTNHTFTWEHASSASTNSGPIPIEYFDGDRPENQCTFIRGFKISLTQGIWATLLGSTTRLSTIVDASPDDMLARTSFIPFRSEGSWVLRRSSSSGRQAPQGSQENVQVNEGMTSGEIAAFVHDSGAIISSDVPPASYRHHPSNIINEHLLKKMPFARVAITHDSDWCAVIGEDENPILNASELLDRVHAMYNVEYQNGAVFLVPNNATSVEGVSLGSNSSLNPKSPTATSTEMTAEKQSDLDENSDVLSVFMAAYTGKTDEESIASEAEEAEAKQISDLIGDGSDSKKVALNKRQLVRSIFKRKFKGGKSTAGVSMNSRVALNNHIQYTTGKQHLVTWKRNEISAGNQPLWEAVALIDGLEFSRATARSLNLAKEEAARLALISFQELEAE